jgi:hypothetical protein
MRPAPIESLMRTLLRTLGTGVLLSAVAISAGGVSYQIRAQPIDGPAATRVPVERENGMCMARAPDRAGLPPAGGSVSIPIRKIGDLERLREVVRTLNTQGYNYRELDPHEPPPQAPPANVEPAPVQPLAR